MTRAMADSISLEALPAGFPVYGGYDDGSWPDADSIKAKFPGSTVIRFTVNPHDDEGDCLDVEKYDANPEDAPVWIVRRRLDGHKGPLVYCSESAWPAVREQFAAQKVGEPGYIVAGYPGSVGVNELYSPPCVGHQYEDTGPYDLSIVVDYLPGIDPAPSPAPDPGPLHPPTTPLEDGMISNPFVWNGNFHTFQCAKGGLWHKWAIGRPDRGSESVVAAAAQANPAVGNPQFPDQIPATAIFGSQLVVMAQDTNGMAWYFVQQAGHSGWAAQELP